jgi:hypothetical protein
LLGLVAAGFVAIQLIAVGPRLALAWDETVYASQIADHAPPAPFVPSRARGITYLIAPVGFTLPDVTVLRIYLAVLAGLALFGAYAVWLRVRRSYAVPLAALLFGGFWTTVFYGPAVMPNLWVAFGAVAATGLTVLVCRQPYRPLRLLGLAAVMAAVALFRPSDSFWLAAVLGLAVLYRQLTNRHRRLAGWRRVGATAAPLGALAVGELAGMAQWIAESYSRYGDPLQRAREASAIQSSKLSDHVGNAMSVLHGPPFCSVRCEAQVSGLDIAFWSVLLLTTVLGLVVAYQENRLRIALLCVGTAVGLALTYLFLVPISAPRFLLPAYALLVLPIAGGLLALPRLLPHRSRQLTVGLVLATAGYLAGEQIVLAHILRDNTRGFSTHAAAALRDAGVRPPCLVVGSNSVEVAFLLGCHPRYPKLPTNDHVPPAVAEALRSKGKTVGVVAGRKPPESSYVQDWTKRLISGVPYRPDARVYVPDRQVTVPAP